MAVRPRAVITTPYPSPAATARVLGVSAKRYRALKAMVTEYLERRGSDRRLDRSGKPRPGRGSRRRITARRRAGR
jgi:hypothetical protein